MPLISRSTALTVMTYNVGNGLAEPRRLVRMLRDADVDLIALQELASSQAAALAFALSDRFPFHVLAAAGFAGKAVFSRFPIRESEQLELYPARPDLCAVPALLMGDFNLTARHPL